MHTPARWLPSEAESARIRAVAAGQEPPDLVVSGARILNVFSGELDARRLGIVAGRIAWNRSDDATPRKHLARTRELDFGDRIVVPGLVEPHAHPELIYGPLALAAAAARQGTTTLCADLLAFVTTLDDAALAELIVTCEQAPARLLWALRVSAEGGGAPAEQLNATRMRNLLDTHSSIVTIGEMTAWRELVDGDERLQDIVGQARRQGMRVNGHLPGASLRSLQRAAVEGVSDDHEAISASDALLRLDSGYWVMARHSSLRHDAREIVAGLIEAHRPLNRVMLTTDGPVAVDLARWHLDEVIRQAIAGGADPVDAVRMATINPATYLGLDGSIGSLAPGRWADLAVLSSDLTAFQVESVLVGGEPPLECGSYPDGLSGLPFRAADISAGLLRRLAVESPAVRMEGIMTRRADDGTVGDVIAAMIGRDGSWIVAMTVTNVRVEAIVSSYAGNGDVLLLGSDSEQLVELYNDVVRNGPAIVTPHHRIPLPLLGMLSTLTVDELAAAIAQISAEIELPGGIAPLEFVLLFLGLGVLPDIRMTPGGVLDVKTGAILAPPMMLP